MDEPLISSISSKSAHRSRSCPLWSCHFRHRPANGDLFPTALMTLRPKCQVRRTEVAVKRSPINHSAQLPERRATGLSPARGSAGCCRRPRNRPLGSRALVQPCDPSNGSGRIAMEAICNRYAKVFDVGSCPSSHGQRDRCGSSGSISSSLWATSCGCEIRHSRFEMLPALTIGPPETRADDRCAMSGSRS